MDTNLRVNKDIIIKNISNQTGLSIEEALSLMPVIKKQLIEFPKDHIDKDVIHKYKTTIMLCLGDVKINRKNIYALVESIKTQI